MAKKQDSIFLRIPQDKKFCRAELVNNCLFIKLKTRDNHGKRKEDNK